ncbi:threonine dehydrogenase-like Zn-dependent dehydrogenase [Catenuloplanes nepalensis]|uniref:Threonine dehydrogenase-like Zn-dependent dehydrogenase n=1 Tax=Catenuloplanes nepalensis TaxID=587533 RepID=A0ABT9MUC8_9ACTN|nr:zinc-binding dehydrogenase [Catenuloplanes nepalensis]MDP9795029.1 threonine dehydrogenase-like Zn-dependent dehydrogenase [Catenuloplanes nepalensis]
MRSVLVTGPGTTEVREVPRPECGDDDVLIAVKACGICGSDAMYTAVGGIPPRQGATPLGHEPAGEVVAVGRNVTGIGEGDHVVVNPMAAIDGIIGSGGAQGALSDLIVIREARAGVHLRVIPPHVPWEVAALNEPMAVARHAVNRTSPKPGDTAVVFGAGPIGLGAVISLKLAGAAHVVAVDLVPNRLEKALAVGADAVINSAEEDVAARLAELHGTARAGLVSGAKPGTDIYLDAAGAPAVLETALASAKHGATLGIVAVHKRPASVDFGRLLTTELTIVLSMGYPSEIFEVTDDLIANWEKYALIVSDTVPFGRVREALTLAATPGAAEKVVVTF